MLDLATMTDGRALVAAIHHAPADDAPRLIFADWLDENGEPDRAAIIRRMVAAPLYAFLWRRGRIEQYSHRKTVRAIRGLRPKLAKIVPVELTNLPWVNEAEVRRGFVEAVSVPAEAFLEGAGRIFAAFPITNIAFEDLWPKWAGAGSTDVVVRVVDSEPFGFEWPARLFPDHAVGDFLRYPSRRMALAELSNRAAGYGRLRAGIRFEPPPIQPADRGSSRITPAAVTPAAPTNNRAHPAVIVARVHNDRRVGLPRDEPYAVNSFTVVVDDKLPTAVLEDRPHGSAGEGDVSDRF
jgi:uncharacterized protein (TIGR02996 family)